MDKARVAIIEDSPVKRQRYKEAVERVGGVVVAEATTQDEARRLLRELDDPDKPVPDVVLTDAVINPEGWERKTDAWQSQRQRLERENRRMTHPFPETDGDMVVREINARKNSAWYVGDGTSSYAGEDLSPRASNIKILGISGDLDVPGADVEHATPDQVADFIKSLPNEETTK